jgi:hypothetical protein
MSTATEHAATAERPTSERKEPIYLFTEKYVADKSEIARRFMDTRERLNANVDKANNFLVKRFYNISSSNSYARRRCGTTMLPPTSNATLSDSSCSARPTPRR